MQWLRCIRPRFSIAPVVALVVAATLALLHAGPAQAGGMHPVAPGEIPELAADEGLLLIAVDASVELDAVYLRKLGTLTNSGVLRKAAPGRHLRLLRVDAGEYVWDRVRTSAGVVYTLIDDPEFHFRVRAGRIVYAGDLSFRPQGKTSAHIHTGNRGLPAIDWLEATHPALYRRYPFSFSGHYPDPFPEFYRQARESVQSPPDFPADMQPPPPPGPLPLPIPLLWRPELTESVSLSPDGDLIAIHRGSEDGRQWTLDMLDRASGERREVARSEHAFEVMQWSGNDSLLLSYRDGGQWKLAVIRRTRDSTGTPDYRRLDLPRAGRVLDPLPEDPAHILLATTTDKGVLLIHKLDISSQASLDRFHARPEDRLNVGLKDERWWFADGHGELSVAVVIRDGESVLMHREGSRFAEFFRMGSDPEFIPAALSYDGTSLIGLSARDREQRELVEYDIANRRISRTLFRKPGIDIVAPLFNARNDAIGVRYYEGGRLVNEYFNEGDRARAALVARRFPGRSVAVLEQSLDASQLILKVDGADVTPKIYHLDVDSQVASLVEESLPWLAGHSFAPSVVVRTKGQDGLPIEAYLTLPPGEGPRPLIVMPHGGPVGVSDHLHFDRDVQFLASLGYAVLRINYRGSAGYGKAFREAGYRSQGTLIEDDIDAALAQALKDHPLDASRMCTLGFSYGGFSALIAAARAPDRYRCAISVSGVSDRLLFFTASDSARTAAGREVLERILGDPVTQTREMTETSPLYRYRDIRIPVMLVHGALDPRVDIEHMRRMRRMLELNGNPPVGFVFEDGGHAILGIERLDRLWSGIAGFLRRHLDGEAVGPGR
jgi:dipeptidyl aminopeptidase/acylaminoacyl peptidase